MSFVLTLLFAFATTPFESTIDRAIAAVHNNDWPTAAAALDQAASEDPTIFDANNFHYLRGRVAENQGDFRRSLEEFKQIRSNNPLYAAASWRAARASAKLRDDAAAMEFLALLPRSFPQELKMQLALETSGTVALQIYEGLSTREARYARARAQADTRALWALIRENKDDDIALDSGRAVAAIANTPTEQMEVAEVFANHRQFENALSLYQRAGTDAVYATDARFRIARIHFQQENYQLALGEYHAIVNDFPGTDWEKEAEYQIASCYWRLADYRNSEKAYIAYIQKYGRTGMKEAATRNLADVYRVAGDNEKALATLDRALATQLSVSTRQVFLFTKAKILYAEKRYTAALALFQQLGRMKLRSSPGATTTEEVQYFQGLCQSKLGKQAAAKAIWQKLSRDEFSYYGQRAAERLGRDPIPKSGAVCMSDRIPVLTNVEADIVALRHPMRNELDPAADIVSELIFLQLWDEASFWMNWSDRRLAPRVAAEIAYLGGRYDRSISLSDRLPKTDSTLPLLYPAGYRKLICEAAGSHKIDPLWLHAIIWQESKYNPTARSGASARGLMQFIPETARAVAVSAGMPPVSVENLYDPAVSIQLGAAYWASLMQKLKSPEMALAAYNGGPDNVQRWMSKSSDPELFVSDIGFVETKRYVMLVFAARAAYGQLAN
jgi:soluble lytic murein transglycosylase-like protein/lipopolysaccharide biosynthesis regulator YciM